MVKLPNTSQVIANNDRVLVVGQTGSGKTILSMTMLFKIKRLLVIDSKDSLAKWNLQEWDNYSLDKIKGGEDFRIRIADNDKAIQALEYIYKYGDAIIYIDEVNSLIPPRKNAPQVIYDIWQRGRERNIGAWAATQRPVSIPIIMVSEAYHFFIFRTTNEEDRKLLSKYSNPMIKQRVVDKYGFYYYNVLDDKTRYFKQLNV